jgi:hypothetical protein
MIIRTATLIAAGLVLAGSCLTATLVVGAETTPTPAPTSAPVPVPKTVTPPSQGLPLAGRTWVEEAGILPTQGVPIGFDQLTAGPLLRMFDKRRNSSAAILHTQGAWKICDGLDGWGGVVEVNGAILQSQPGPARSSWRIVSWHDAVATVRMDIPYPEAAYVHQTHLVRGVDGTLHALAGIHAKNNGRDHYEYSRSDDAGLTWSPPERILEGANAHDNLVTTCSVWDGGLLFIGRLDWAPRAWLRENDGRWTETSLPSSRAEVCMPRVVDGRLGMLFIEQFKRGSARLAWSWRDGAGWGPVTIVSDKLPADDVLLQVPPVCVLHGRHILVGASVSFGVGEWKEEEFATRLWASEDAGATWLEIPAPQLAGHAALRLVANWDGDDIVATSYFGRQAPQPRLWRLPARK